jgi:hypothetical protein
MGATEYNSIWYWTFLVSAVHIFRERANTVGRERSAFSGVGFDHNRTIALLRLPGMTSRAWGNRGSTGVNHRFALTKKGGTSCGKRRLRGFFAWSGHPV